MSAETQRSRLSPQQRTALLSVIAAIFLVALKLVTGIVRVAGARR